MASQQEIRRRSSAADRVPLTESVVSARATTTTYTSSPDMPRTQLEPSPKFDTMPRACRDDRSADADAMPPPPLPQSGEPSPTRHSRASSTVSSRHKNRLSLTLPVALPIGESSRVTESPVAPVSAVAISIPPTPMETPSGVASPSNANELIIAIAAQERRVLELREELTRAETELAKLKKQWASEEVYRKRGDSQRVESSASTVSSVDDDAFVASRRSVELDRRKLLLQTHNSPAQSRRKIIRGGHTRTLSLLSPVRTEGSFSIHEDIKPEAIPLPSMERRSISTQLANPNLAKRASWQTRTPQPPAAVGVPQFVEDFKIGLRAFVEDIRLITVGDEPVAGQPPRPIPPASQRNGAINKDQPKEQDTTKPPGVPRTKTSTASDRSSAATSTTTPVKTPEPKARNGKIKHFSWTPLGFDSLDDTDWSNWDSPVSTKSARWSGSTMNSSSIDEIGSIPEKEDENITKSTKKATVSEMPLLSPTLEILPNVVNRLSPSNLKRTANNFMNEWEKSLMTPDDRGKENNV